MDNCENTRKDRLQNEESHSRLFGHVYRQAINTPVRAWIQVNGKKKGRRRTKIPLIVVKKARMHGHGHGHKYGYEYGYDTATRAIFEKL